MNPLQAALAAMLGLLLYAWVGYPLALALLVRLHPRPRRPAARATAPLPSLVHVLIAAFNEEDVIAGRVRNLQSIDAAGARLRVYIGTDGCTDRTAAMARLAIGDDPRFTVHPFPANRGKVAVLRDLVAIARGQGASLSKPQLLVFTDANTEFAPAALTRLIAPFADPAIGAVCGRLVFRAGTGGTGVEENAYWRFETRLKMWESALDSCLGANGAIYALRPELFWAVIPENTIVDDLVIGMRVRAAGYRVVYEATAVATEELPTTRSEWGRRVRIGAGDYQALWLCRACLLPRYGWFAWCFLSHKVLRWFTPHLLALLVLVASASLWTAASPSTLAVWVLSAAGGALAAAGLGRLWSPRAARPPTGLGRLQALLRLTDHFLTMQAALLAGFVRFCRGNLGGAWRRTPRGNPSPG